MYEIFYESSIKIIGYGLFLAVPLYVMAFHFRRRGLWIACGVITSLLVVALLVEWFVVTPKEEVEQAVIDLARIVEQNDVDGLLEHISKTRPEVLHRAKHEMPSYDFSVCNLFKLHSVNVDENNPRKATADFMVRFSVTTRGYAGGGFRDVLLKYEKEDDDQWRIVDYNHFDPTNRPGRQNFFY